MTTPAAMDYVCRSGIRTINPAYSALISIWQLSRLLGLRSAAGGRSQHLFLLLADGRQAVEECRIDVNMAGGAHARAAALRDDAVDSILDCVLHDRCAHGHVDRGGLARMRDISNIRHDVRKSLG